MRNAVIPVLVALAVATSPVLAAGTGAVKAHYR
jgi:hypothetical protein